MGYPTEIPNSFPEPRPVPVESSISRWLRAIWSFITAPFTRRRTHRVDHPERYQQGVDPTSPRIPPGASRELDFEEIEDQLESSSSQD